MFPGTAEYIWPRARAFAEAFCCRIIRKHSRICKGWCECVCGVCVCECGENVLKLLVIMTVPSLESSKEN